jgi:hypothetical protein
MNSVHFPLPGKIWSREDINRLGYSEIEQLSELSGKYEHVDTADTLLCAPHLRQILERLDLILKIGGCLIVRCSDFSDNPYAGRRTGTQVQYELACLFPDAYLLYEKKYGAICFRKMKNGRQHSQGRISLTLGYITDGRDLGMIVKTLYDLKNVIAVDVKEVMIAGPADAAQKLSEIYPMIKHVGDYKHDDARPPINRKKALIIDATVTENLILAHDRFYFDEKYWQTLGRHGNYFDFYNCRHCLASGSAKESEINIVGAFGMHSAPTGAFSYSIRSTTCDMRLSNPHFYNNGGLYVGKTSWFKGGRWPLHLHWGDLEDVHFTRRCEMDGAVWHNDWSNRVFSTNKRLALVKKPRFDQLLRTGIQNGFSAAIFWIKNREFEVR